MSNDFHGYSKTNEARRFPRQGSDKVGFSTASPLSPLMPWKLDLRDVEHYANKCGVGTTLPRIASFSGSALQALGAPYSISLISLLDEAQAGYGLTSFVDMADNPVPRNHSRTHSIPEQ